MNKKIISVVMATSLMVASSSMAFAANKKNVCTNKNCLVHMQNTKSNYKDSIAGSELKFLQRVNVNRALNDMSVLSEKIGPRVSTTNEEYQGAKYIKNEFKKMGYDAEIQSFERIGSSTGEVKNGDTVLTSRVFSSSTPTDGAITAEIVDCGLGYPEDLTNVKGKIALIQRGDLTFVQKVQNATDAGAIAVVMYNNSGTSATSGQCNPNCVPAVGITRADGLALVEKLNAGEKVTLSVKVDKPPVSNSWNVVATKTAKGEKVDSNDIVCVSAHMDSVPLAPGANDNASGSVAMLEIARAMKNLDIDKEVRFIACGSEEVGLLGSRAYVASLSEDEKSRIVGDFNMDMVATAYDPCSELAVYTNDGKENVITDAMAKASAKLSCASTKDVSYDGYFDGQMNSSDHVPFQDAGIPASLFINVDPAKKDAPRSAIEPYYHKPEDVMANVSKARLERTIKLVGVALYDTLNVE